jgi:glucosamine 6-phosphate synthetase-like amidotransferase/phosphosugar isomerase protein
MGDSCGVTTDGEIYHGSLTTKNYGDFIVNTGYERPNKFPVVFGHTRKSSSGGINANNIHPLDLTVMRMVMNLLVYITVLFIMLTILL